jgi:hypothetical protein
MKHLYRAFPWIVAILCLALLIPGLMPVSDKGPWDWRGFGAIPVSARGEQSRSTVSRATA